MILDKQEEFADAMTVGTTAASNVAATNVIDTLLIQTPFDITQVAGVSGQTLTGTVGTKDLGIGEPMWFVIQMDAAAAGGTNATWSLVSSITSDLATPTTHLTTGAIVDASLTAGITVYASMLPSGAYKRYLGVLLTTTGTHSAGTYSAFLTRNLQKNVNYPAAYLVG